MDSVIMEPIIFTSLKEPEFLKLKENVDTEFIDLSSIALEELLEITKNKNNSNKKIDKIPTSNQKKTNSEKDSDDFRFVAVYLPWSKKLLQIPQEKFFNKIRSSRNRNLITPDQQRIIRHKCIAFAGMSVGSNVLKNVVQMVGPRRLILADSDNISIANLNRLDAPLSAVGEKKVNYFAKRAWEQDPFLQIAIYSEGLIDENLKRFFTNVKPDIFVEEMDDPRMKILSRLYARNLRIPVVMAADNGDGAIIDVERYDLEPGRRLMHGRLEEYSKNPDRLRHLSFKEKMLIVGSFVDLSDATIPALESLKEVGTTLNTWPQLGTAANIVGASLTYVIKKILLGKQMPSGRYYVSLDRSLNKSYSSLTGRIKRRLIRRSYIRHFRKISDGS